MRAFDYVHLLAISCAIREARGGNNNPSSALLKSILLLAENKNLVPSGVGRGLHLGARRVLELLPGLDPRAGSSAASSHATSTRWLFEAAAVLRRPSGAGRTT